MKKRSILLFGIVMFYICGLFVVPFAGALPDFTVNPDHPRIFITQDNIDELRDRAATTHSDDYASLKQWCDDNWGDLEAGRSFTIYDLYEVGHMRYALIYALGEIPGFTYSHSIDEYGDMAVAILDSIPDQGWGEGTLAVHRDAIAISYDWANDRMSQAQKKNLVDLFIDYIGAPAIDGTIKGYRFTYTPKFLYPALAFYGDGANDSQAQIYIDFIPTWIEDSRASSHMSGQDGGHATGHAYAKMSQGAKWHLAQDFYALITATSLTIGDTFDKYPYNNGYASWFLYGIQPGPISPARYTDGAVATFIKFEDSTSQGWNLAVHSRAFYNTLNLMAQLNNDNGSPQEAQLITWLADVRLESLNNPSVYQILFKDKSVSPHSPDQLGVPLVKAFGWDETDGAIESYLDNPKAGLGQVYMKSSWDIGLEDTSTTYSTFRAFPYYYFGHQHFDSLSFSIFKGEELALSNSGAYYHYYEGGDFDTSGAGFPHHWYYFERTPAHNSLLILDPNEDMITWYGTTQHIKDGGQRTFHDPGGVWGDIIEGSEKDWGGLIKHEDADDYTYSSGDATKGYNSLVDGVQYLTEGSSPKTTLVQRDYVYLKSDNIEGSEDYFVVFDRVDSTDPSFKKVFLLNTIGEPELNGDETTIYGDADNGLFESDNSDYFTITNPSNNARLFMKTLLPDSTKVYKMGGAVSAVTTESVNNIDGATIGGPKIDIGVSDTSVFTDKPTVTIEGTGESGISKECFMCEGKTATQLINCIRGERVWRFNDALSINDGAEVKQEFTWMIREADKDWIGYPYEYGKAYLEADFKKDVDEYGRWALRIETVDDEIHSNFLHVLHPTVDMGEAQMAETTLIETGNMKGALIKDPSNLRIVMFSPDTSQVSSVTYDADYLSSQTGKHLITGLVPNVNYKIYKNGIEIDSMVSSNQGTIYFESTGGSTFSLSTAALEDCESIGGTCKDDSCSSYTDCNSLAGICSAGYCCQGSCEAASSCESGADEDNSGVVSMVEVVAFIDGWKTGGITIAQVLDAIGEWKDGC